MAQRVFVVDDEPCIADTLATILQRSGYEVRPFYDAQSALEQFDALRPELVITDVMMPGMNGVEMAILIKQRHPDCKILLFSGQAATVNLLETARKQGYEFDILAKPVHPSDLLAKIKTPAASTEAA